MKKTAQNGTPDEESINTERSAGLVPVFVEHQEEIDFHKEEINVSQNFGQDDESEQKELKKEETVEREEEQEVELSSSRSVTPS